MKLKNLILSLSLLICLSACKSDGSKVNIKDGDYWTLELIEVFTANNDGSEATKGNLTFKETKVTDSDGKQMEHWYYNYDGQLTAFERYVYGKDEEVAFKSNFYDYKDSLLSYYVFEYDDRGNKIKTNSYDASSNELLRVEEFNYNTKNQRVQRQIKTATGQLLSLIHI